MRKNDAVVAKIVITRLTKGFMAMFAPAESLPSPATLLTPDFVRSTRYSAGANISVEYMYIIH